MKDIFDNSDVKILPRSKTLVYTKSASTLPYADEESLQNLDYVEQRLYSNVLYFGDYRIEPNGLDNNFPFNYKSLLDNVYIGHGVKRTLINLLLSGGVGIYKEVKEEKKIIRDWQIDNEISDWLDSFDFHNEYIPEAATDMIYVENLWTAFNRNKGSRIGKKPFIAGLQYLSAENMRLEYPNENGKRTKVFYSEWLYSNLRQTDIQSFPVFDKRDPFRNPTSVMFTKMPTFGSTSYGRPPDIGAVAMLKVLSLLPAFHKANLTERGFKWIVAIHQDYYQKIREENHWTEKSKEFKEWKEKFQDSIDEFLTAPEGDKVQTRFMTEFKIDRFSNKPVKAVEITKLEDDTKELSEVGAELHDTYTAGYVSAASIHPQLANIHMKNHALSGSNLREAYEMHIKTAVPTMRMLLLHPVNTALKINFPGKNLKAGFMDVAFEDFNEKNSTVKKENNAL